MTLFFPLVGVHAFTPGSTSCTHTHTHTHTHILYFLLTELSVQNQVLSRSGLFNRLKMFKVLENSCRTFSGLMIWPWRAPWRRRVGSSSSCSDLKPSPPNLWQTCRDKKHIRPGSWTTSVQDCWTLVLFGVTCRTTEPPDQEFILFLGSNREQLFVIIYSVRTGTEQVHIGRNAALLD